MHVPYWEREIQKNLSKDQPYIIAGGGLGGTILAAELCFAGLPVILADSGLENAASSIAAGLFNLITGRFSVPTWRAGELHLALMGFFDRPQFSPLKNYLHNVAVYRPFHSIAEQNDWSGKASDPPYSEFSTWTESPHPSGIFDDPSGGYTVIRSGWLDIPPFLRELKEILVRDFSLQIEKTFFNPLNVNTLSKTLLIEDREVKYGKLIFADGVSANKNPFWSWMPILPLKGQILVGEFDGPDPGCIFSGGSFLFKKPSGDWLCGSTYERTYDHPFPDEAGKAEILSRLPESLRKRFRVTQHLAGIRPATRDRIPVLGEHPTHKDVYTFNGLGAKGVLHAPWMAKTLVHHFLHPEFVPEREYSVSRFLKRFFVS